MLRGWIDLPSSLRTVLDAHDLGYLLPEDFLDSLGQDAVTTFALFDEGADPLPNWVGELYPWPMAIPSR